MTEPDEESEEKQGTVQHLEAALDAEEKDEINYHLRQALQLLGVE